MIFQILKLIENDLFEPERRISLPPKSETLNLWTQLISPKLWHFFWTSSNYWQKYDRHINCSTKNSRPACLFEVPGVHRVTRGLPSAWGWKHVVGWGFSSTCNLPWNCRGQWWAVMISISNFVRSLVETIMPYWRRRCENKWPGPGGFIRATKNMRFMLLNGLDRETLLAILQNNDDFHNNPC